MEEQFYKLIDMYNDSLDKLVQLPIFNPEEWRKWKSHYSAEETKDINAVKALRKLIILSTSKVLDDQKYKLPDGTDCPLPPPSDLSNTFYTDALQLELPSSPPSHTIIQVKNQDCLEAGIYLQNLGLNPVILNMASITRPGGGYRNGANGQEENIFRRSNISMFMDTDYARIKYYPLPEYGGIYTRNVTVFRGSEEEGYAFMEKPVIMHFASVAAYARPQIVQVKRDKVLGFELAPKITEKTKNKVRVILNIALANGHDSIVLGAFGCGAFRNPPDHIARIFSGVINKEYKGKFKHILFAILEDENSRRSHNPLGNLLPFREIFERAKEELVVNGKEEEQVNKERKVVEFFSVKENHGYLSNFSKHSFKLKGKEWPTAAHYIEAQKFAGNPAEEEIRTAKTPQLAEKIAGSYAKKVRGDWNAVREEIVRNAVEAKFDQNNEIQQQLIETGTDTLVFHSKDNFYGDGLQGHGKNVLGKILMDVRQIFMNKNV